MALFKITALRNSKQPKELSQIQQAYRDAIKLSQMGLGTGSSELKMGLF